jgi:hypothetical protein
LEISINHFAFFCESAFRRMKRDWEIIADNLSKAGWSWAHRDDGKRFIVHADEKLTAFLELESAIRACGRLARQAGVIRRSRALLWPL